MNSVDPTIPGQNEVLMMVQMLLPPHGEVVKDCDSIRTGGRRCCSVGDVLAEMKPAKASASAQLSSETHHFLSCQFFGRFVYNPLPSRAKKVSESTAVRMFEFNRASSTAIQADQLLLGHDHSAT